jgi:hypothetical protein
LLAALPAAAQTEDRTDSLIGRLVGFRDGLESGRIVDVWVNGKGGIGSVVVVSGGERITVPWREVRLDVGEGAGRTLRKRPSSRLFNGGARLERRVEVDVPAVTPTARIIREETIVRPVPSRITLSGDPFEDYLRYRFGYESIPGWRPADLLKDRFEARRAPPLRPWPLPTPVSRPLHSSIP